MSSSASERRARADAAARDSAGAAGPHATAPFDLAATELWLQREIVLPHEGGERPPAAGHPPIDAVVRSTPDLPAERRVGIYASAYFLRLLGVLESDFKATRALVGEEAFEHLARGYLARHPSRTFTLNPLGWRFGAYLGEVGNEDVPVDRALVRDVATLEATISEVFDAPYEAPLTAAGIAAVPADAWPEARIRMISALRTHVFDYPASRIVTELRHDREPPPLAPERTFVAVYRSSWLVWRAEMSQTRYTLLRALMDGLPLADALERAAAIHEGPLEDLEGSLFHWLREWVADGLLGEVRPG